MAGSVAFIAARLARQRAGGAAGFSSPELFPGQHIFVWTGRALTPLQAELLSHWQSQGFTIEFHGVSVLEG